MKKKRVFLLFERTTLEGSPMDKELIGIYESENRVIEAHKELSAQFPENLFSYENVPMNRVLYTVEV